MSLPEKFKINSVEYIDNLANVESDTKTLGFLSRNLTGQRFEFRVRSIALQQGELKEVSAGLSAIRRSNNPINLFLPIFSESAATTKTAAQAINPGQFGINLNNTTSVKVGDFFNFAGHTKAYQVTLISGVRIEFYPNLVRAVPSGQLLTFNGARFSCKIKGRPQKFNLTADGDAAIIEIDLVEVV